MARFVLRCVVLQHLWAVSDEGEAVVLRCRRCQHTRRLDAAPPLRAGDVMPAWHSAGGAAELYGLQRRDPPRV